MAQLPFTYDEFEAWHRAQTAKLLRPALRAVNTALESYFDKGLTETQRVRVNVTSGRVKSAARTWRKLNIPRYRDKITDLDSIPIVLDDLIATRIVCTNTSDLNRVWEFLGQLELWEDGREPVLALEAGSQRDYCDAPKPSGYRARHLNLRTAVNDGLRRSVVTCEVQVRTLLQDSWGELTHEDTYKPGSKVPPLITTLARRMADLLATLDEIAEDLRSELDTVDEALETSQPADVDLIDTVANSAILEPIEVAANAYLQRRASELDRPLALAALAWEMQREFGQDLSHGWLGHGTFKALLMAANPGIEISGTPPSYVIPAGYRYVAPSHQFEVESRFGDVPMVIAFLRSIDQSFPVWLAGSWRTVFESLSSATAAFLPEAAFDLRLLNELTRIARDRSVSVGTPSSRSAFDYVAKGIWYSGRLTSNMSPEDVGECFFAAILNRVRDAISVSDESKQELRAWLGLVGE